MLSNEMERRLKNNPSNTAPLAVLLDFELGTRKGEILAISRSDISGNKIHIHRQLVEEYGYSYKDFLFVKDGSCLSPDAVVGTCGRIHNLKTLYL